MFSYKVATFSGKSGNVHIRRWSEKVREKEKLGDECGKSCGISCLGNFPALIIAFVFLRLGRIPVYMDSFLKFNFHY